MTERSVHYDSHDWLVIADVDGWLGLRREHVRTWAPETACREAGEKPGIKLRFKWSGCNCTLGTIRVGRLIEDLGEFGGWVNANKLEWFPTVSEARAYVEAAVTEAIRGAMEP